MKNCWMCKYFTSDEKCKGCKNTTDKPNFVLWINKDRNSDNKDL